MNELDGIDLRIKPHRRAKRMKLRYDAANNCAIVTVPVSSRKSDATKFALKHMDWLQKQKNAAPIRTLLMPDYVIPVRGIERPIVHYPELATAVVLTDDEIQVGGHIEGFPKRVENFLKKLAREAIEPHAEMMAKQTGRNFRKIQVRDTKSRWGSCSSSGTLSFSWRLIMAPPEILEYVVAHEIAHLSEMNHSSSFWRIVDELVPNARPARRWLKQEGQNLMLILSEPE